MIKDSGDHKQQSEAGAVRSSSEGRGTPSLLPFDALMALAKHFEDGAAVYAPRNWEKGIPLSRYIDSMFRHLAEVMNGDTSESHERSLAWNALCFLATWMRIEKGELPGELDDLPHYVARRSRSEATGARDLAPPIMPNSYGGESLYGGKAKGVSDKERKAIIDAITAQ